jgi:uncharacterized protein
LSNPEHIRALEELAAMDADVKALEEQLAEGRGVLSALTEGLKKLGDRLAAERTQLAASDKQRGEIQIDLRTMMNQIEHSREKLNRSRTERESQAAQRELEEMRKLVRDREDELTRVDGENQNIRASIESVEAEHKRVQEELDAKKGDLESKVAQLEADRNARSAGGGGREAIVKRLPPVLYRRYEQLRTKRGTAIAQTTDGTCKACNMALPPQLFHKLRREPLIDQCPSCYRIIYFVPPEPAQKVE